MAYSEDLSSWLTTSAPTPSSYNLPSAPLDALAGNVYGGGNAYTSPMMYDMGQGVNTATDFGGTVAPYTSPQQSLNDFANNSYINNLPSYNQSDFYSNQLDDMFSGNYAEVDSYGNTEGSLMDDSVNAQFEESERAFWSKMASDIAARDDRERFSAQELASTVMDDGAVAITETEILDLSRDAILGNKEKYKDITANELKDQILTDIETGNFASTDFQEFLQDSGNSLDAINTDTTYSDLKAAASGDVGTLVQKLKMANDGGYNITIVDDKYYDEAMGSEFGMTQSQYEQIYNEAPLESIYGDFSVGGLNNDNAYESIFRPEFGLGNGQDQLTPTYGDYLLGNYGGTAQSDLIKGFDNPLLSVRSNNLNSIDRRLSPQTTQNTDIRYFNPKDTTGMSRDAAERFSDFERTVPVYSRAGDRSSGGLPAPIQKGVNAFGRYVTDPIDDLFTGGTKIAGNIISGTGDVLGKIPIIGKPLDASLGALGGGVSKVGGRIGDVFDGGIESIATAPISFAQGLGNMATGNFEKGLNNMGRAGSEFIQIGKDLISVPVGMASTVINTIAPFIPKDVKISISAGAGMGGGGGGGGSPSKSKSSNNGTKVTRTTKTGGNVSSNDRAQPIRYDKNGNPVTLRQTGGGGGGSGGSLTGASASANGSAGPAGGFDLSTRAGQQAYVDRYGTDSWDPNSQYFLPNILQGLGYDNLISSTQSGSSMNFQDYAQSVDYSNTGRNPEGSETKNGLEELSQQVAELKKLGDQSVPAAYRV